MSKAWKIISVIVLIALLVGAVCAMTGSVTGADYDRILSVLNAKYNLMAWVSWIQDCANIYISAIKGLCGIPA